VVIAVITRIVYVAGHRRRRESGRPACDLGVDYLDAIGRRSVGHVAVDVAHCDADVVALGEVLDDDMFFPRRVLVPGNVAGIAQDDVRFFVGIHVSDGDAVADPYLVIDRDMPERGQIRRLAKRSPAEQGENENG